MKKPFYLSKETWEKLSKKEKKFIILLREKRFTESEIMKKLFITTRQGYWKIRDRVRRKVENDLKNVYILK